MAYKLKMELTPQQAEVLEFIRLYREKYGKSPTRHEIREGFGWSSQQAVECHLLALRRKGKIKQIPRINRGIRLL